MNDKSSEWWDWYNRYLNSGKWKVRRDDVLRSADWECQSRIACGGARATIAHHLTYKRVGNESQEDLQAVCIECHDAIHSDPNKETAHPVTVSELFGKILDDIKSGKSGMGCSWRLPELDYITCGIRPGMVSVLGAPAGFGKTSKALEIAAAAACAGKKVLFISSMETRECCIREFSRYAGREAHSNVWFFCAFGAKVEDIDRLIRRQHKKHAVDLVIVDSVQFITTYRGYSKRKDQVSHVAGALRVAIRTTETAGLLISTLERSKYDRDEFLPYLEDAEDLENGADQIVIGSYSRGESMRDFTVVKNKDGPVISDSFGQLFENGKFEHIGEVECDGKNL